MADLALPAAAGPPGVSVFGVDLEVIVFVALGGLSIGSALVAIAASRLVHAAFGLLGTFFGVAGLYALLGADFVALAQVLIYVGGILVLLVFGVLLTERVMGPLGAEDRPRRLWPVLAGGLLLLGLLGGIHATAWDRAWDAEAAGEAAEPTTKALGEALLDPGGYLVPFELASVLLLAALIGAAYLVRRRRTP